jgi:hypothetical protein
MPASPNVHVRSALFRDIMQQKDNSTPTFQGNPLALSPNVKKSKKENRAWLKLITQSPFFEISSII